MKGYQFTNLGKFAVSLLAVTLVMCLVAMGTSLLAAFLPPADSAETPSPSPSAKPLDAVSPSPEPDPTGAAEPPDASAPPPSEPPATAPPPTPFPVSSAEDFWGRGYYVPFRPGEAVPAEEDWLAMTDALLSSIVYEGGHYPLIEVSALPNETDGAGAARAEWVWQAFTDFRVACEIDYNLWMLPEGETPWIRVRFVTMGWNK